MRGLHNMLLVFLLTILVKASTCSEVVGLTYEKLETALVTDSNIETLHEHLYPINDHKKCIVNITYEFIMSKDNNTSEICFHWLSSPVHLSINDQLLHGLSLQTYIPETSNILLQVDIHNLSAADLKDINQELKQIHELRSNHSYSILCDTKNKVLDALNDFTANAHMYAAGEKMPFHEEDPNDRGYSVYYYDPNVSSKYCVLHRDNDYTLQRNLLNSGSVLVALFAALAFPLLFAKLYKPLVGKLNTTSGSEYWRYITWSTVVVSLVVILLILANDAIVCTKFIKQYDSLSIDSFIFMVLFAAFSFLAWILDLVACMLVIKCVDNMHDVIKDLKIPDLLTNILEKLISRCNINRHCCPECIATVFGYTIFVHFLRLVSFHVLYIMLGAIAAPSETLSVFCSYITAYASAIIYVAIVFKYLSKEHFETKVVVLKIIFCCIIPLCLAGLMLIASIALFTAFFYKFNIVMEITARNEGFWGVIKSFLPAVLVAFLGFCGHKLLVYITQTSGPDNSNPAQPKAEERDQDTPQQAEEGSTSHQPSQHHADYGTLSSGDKTAAVSNSYSSGSGDKQPLLQDKD